ncbi:MAG: C10 family peptidase [Prevotella sp.]|nr:C10 family peptidase [Prevotella sp.]
MNRICCVAIAIWASLFAMANPVTQLQALRKAQDFAGQHLRLTSGQMKLAHVGLNDGVAGWFAFNMPAKKGFVIISGNDQTEEILGYSDQGEFDYDNMPENMKVWLEQYSQSMQAINDGVMRPAKAKHPTEVVEPLITSLWGQKEPFNSQCPQVNASRCPTGCTAVAMAQVMRYHRFPTESIDAIPTYTTTTLGIDMPELPATTFDWDKMPDVLTTESPQESINEVAKLMLYCGQSTDMDYVATGSGAYTSIIPQRLPKYFNYPKTIHYVYRRSYDEAQWDSLLVRELLNGRPVIYTAYTNLTQGHTFICDGYDGNGLYHINWGWLGAGNGYYRISVACAEGEGLDENIRNYQLSINQSALIGIKPEGRDDFVAPAETYCAYSRPSLKDGSDYTRTAKNKDFQGITIKQIFINSTSVSKNPTYGMALFNESGKIVKVLSAFTTKLSAGATKTMESADLAFGAGLTGHYTIKAAYQPSANADWQAMGGTDRNYIDVVITTKEMTLTAVPKAHFEVKGIEMDNEHLNISFVNNDEDFYGPIYLRKRLSTTQQITMVTYDNISFESGTSRDFTIFVDKNKKFDPYADEYYLSVDEYDTQYFYTNLWEENSTLEKDIEILNLSDDGTTIIGDRAMCRVRVTNTGEKKYKNYLTVSTVDNNEQVTEAVRELIELQPGESLVREYDVPFSDFSLDYFLMASHQKSLNTWVNDSTGMKHVAEGAIYWTKDGLLRTKLAEAVFHVPEEAVAINLRNAYTSNVIPNSNPNTIYMLDKRIPSKLANSNYVNASNKGGKLTMVDGYDYFFPIEMTFSGGVSYEREIADTLNFEWSTLALPFTPDYVSVDGSLLSWYADAESEEGDFWLFDFMGVKNDTVATAYAEGVKANVPCMMACDNRLAGKTVMFFTAEKTTVLPTNLHPSRAIGDFALVGTNMQEQVEDGYVLSDNHWVRKDNATDDATEASATFAVDAFRAFVTTMAEQSGNTLTIDADSVINPQFAPQPILMGDVNGDGFINITDVTLIINYMLGVQSESFSFERANMNGDEFINMSDVSAIISTILNK